MKILNVVEHRIRHQTPSSVYANETGLSPRFGFLFRDHAQAALRSTAVGNDVGADACRFHELQKVDDQRFVDAGNGCQGPLVSPSMVA